MAGYVCCAMMRWKNHNECFVELRHNVVLLPYNKLKTRPAFPRNASPQEQRSIFHNEDKIMQIVANKSNRRQLRNGARLI